MGQPAQSTCTGTRQPNVRVNMVDTNQADTNCAGISCIRFDCAAPCESATSTSNLAGSTLTSPQCCNLTQVSRRFMQSNAPDGLTFMSTCLFDLGLDTFLFVPYLLLCYYAYLDVSCFLLQPRLSSIFAVQPGKEFTASPRLLANVYCWYIVASP